jgi:hypothetical protein
VKAPNAGAASVNLQGQRGRIMSKHVVLAVFLFVALTGTTASAQSLCPAGVPSDKLICLIPQVYGANGFVLPTASGSQFQNTFLTTNLTALNSAIAKQSALLPLASPSSGITFSLDPATQTPIRSTDSFGPILGERADTIGKYRLFLAFSYQYFKFDSIDGLTLKHLPAVFGQPDDSVDVTNLDGSPRTCSVTGDNTGACGFIRDVIKTDNRIDLKIHQFTTFVSFGLTNRIDVSIVIPIENVRMGVFSNATIVDNSLSGLHSFSLRSDCGSVPPPSFVPCLNQPFSNIRSVSGVGDMTLRVKGEAWKGERAGLALGVDVRVPTGDALNFLGAGAAGVKPFVVWSYRARISPHVFVGYETNGSSVLASDVSTGQKERLPGQLTYSGGADVWLTKWFTAAFDMVGQQVFEARRSTVTTFQELPACMDKGCTGFKATGNIDRNLSQITESYNITNASLGVKLRPFASLLVTGNVLMKLNNAGLRANVIPLVGVSYTF